MASPGRPAGAEPRPIVRAPRTGPGIISLPSGVETSQQSARSAGSVGRSLHAPGMGGTSSISVPLPSGTETLRSQSRPRAETTGPRVPRAAAPAMRIDAAGAPAHDFGTPAGSVATGVVSANARDGVQGSRDTGARGERGQGNWQGRHQGGGDDHDHRDHGDHHDRSHRGHSHRGFGGFGNNFGFGIGLGLTRPTNYAYDLGGPWYSDIFGDSFGYHTPLYAWQYDTTGIYTWDTSPTYSTAWCPDVWAWRDCLSPATTSYITGGSYSIPTTSFYVGDVGILGGNDAAIGIPLPTTPTMTAEQRANESLLSRINPHYDALPDFGSAIEAVAIGDYSASIYAMRRAAGVNPAALMGSGTAISTSIFTDKDVEQKVRLARQVFQNPPARIVSEADAHFMVGALSASLGDANTADEELAKAQAAGDISASTELLRRAVRGDSLGPATP